MNLHTEPIPLKQIDTLSIDSSSPTPTFPQNNTPIPFVPTTFAKNNLPTDLHKNTS